MNYLLKTALIFFALLSLVDLEIIDIKEQGGKLITIVII